MANYKEIIENLRGTFKSGITKSVKYRKNQLENLIKMYDEGEDELVTALKEDLGKPQTEALMFEIDFNKNFVKTVLASMDKWAEDEYVEKNAVTMLDTTYIHREPLGVCLVMGAWNYPVQLSLQPVSGAIASGNCVVIKPSDLAPATAKVIEKLVLKYLDPASVVVVNGGIPETSALLKEKFDHIFFTGGSHVGKIVAEAASKHLTPCILELGGKCPVYLDDTVDLRLAVKRIVWGKMINLGQTCVAPDYILCNGKVVQAIVPMIKQVTNEFFGENRENSKDLCRIVNGRHFQRLKNIIDNTKGTIEMGGKMLEDEKFIDLHVVTNVTSEDTTMQEEIFGPILPIVQVESVNEAVDFINSKAKPLSLYIFSQNKSKQKEIIDRTSAGSVCVNDVIIQLSIDTLPFGGVGDSGYGAYHGQYTYDAFCHKKSVLIRDFSAIGEKIGSFRYPPYTENNIKTSRRLMAITSVPTSVPPFIKNLFMFGLGIGFVIIVKAIIKATGGTVPEWI